MTPGADQLHERAYGTEGTVGRLEQLVSPFRDRIREAVGSLGRTLDRARETLDKIRLGDASISWNVGRRPPWPQRRLSDDSPAVTTNLVFCLTS
jgi:hypothetical protein